MNAVSTQLFAHRGFVHAKHPRLTIIVFTCSLPQLFALTVPAGVSLPSPSCLGNFTVAAPNTPVSQNISSLTSETPYRACAVAYDNTRLQNRQTAASSKDFVTLDVTPPQLSVQPIAGSDGNFTCSR